ncbi:MAG: 2Fe-2S iron-sulfur cluster-binding protein, partial [Candidatus Korarchaeota archaeon]|nr:2Fe-2S iron-sulfur cluster-binding protein [Candidatus Korarchaeota archaeon]
MSPGHRVRVRGRGEIWARRGESLGRVLASRGLMPLPCGGRGFCGQCVVRVWGRVSPPTGNERVRGLGGELRLACQTLVLGDVEVELLHRPVARVPVSSIHLEIVEPRPMFTLRAVAVS